jgi:hypothetical protein
MCFVITRCLTVKCWCETRMVWNSYYMKHMLRSILTLENSYHRRLYRRDHEGSPQVHPLVRIYHLEPPYKHPLIISPSLYVYNKVDSIGLEFLDALAREPYTAVMSCELDLGVQDVVERIWKELRLMRLYTKKYAQPTQPPNESSHSINWFNFNVERN